MSARTGRGIEQRNLDVFYRHIEDYARNELFGQTNTFVVEGNPYRRPIRPQDIGNFDFSEPLSRDAFPSAQGLAAHRMLLNIYESDLMFLPSGPLAAVEGDFRAFYGDGLKAAGEAVRPTLERHVFGFLDRDVAVSGPWTLAAMRAFFAKRIEAANAGPSPVMAAIEGARLPEEAARTFLIQLASDFLCEASAMARNLLGNYGQPMSELFKILIDEYGYGVHVTKHSTLFEGTLSSRGLSSDVHAYWQFYLPSSLGLVNYFHYVSRNHANFFRYLGALYFTESTLPHANRRQAETLGRVFGGSVDLRYFEEHVHIDRHHGRMAIEKVIMPLIERCGECVIPDMVRGFEEFRLLQDLADADLVAQIEWADRRADYRERARALLESPGWLAGRPIARFRESEGELSVTHVHDEDELLFVEEGELELAMGYGQALSLGEGEGVLIPRGRLHGSVVRSPSCAYAVAPASE